MFGLTVVDHLCLESNRVEQNYTLHAQAAERLTNMVFKCRIAIAALLAVTTSATIAALLTSGRVFGTVAAITSALTLLTFGTYAAFALDARLFAHRAFAHRLWIVAERYRALLTEVHDEIVDMPALLRRRDELTREVHAAYEFGFGADQPGHESDRLAPVATSA